MKKTALEQAKLLGLKNSEAFATSARENLKTFTSTSIFGNTSLEQARAGVANKTFANGKTVDLNSLSSDQLKELQNTYLDATNDVVKKNLAIQQKINELNQKINKDGTLGGAGKFQAEFLINKLKSEQESNDKLVTALKGDAGTIGQSLQIKRLVIDSTIETSKEIKNINDRVDAVSKQLSSAKASGSKKRINEAEALSKQLQSEIANEIPAIAEATGVDKDTIAKYIDNSIRANLKATTGDAVNSLDGTIAREEKTNKKAERERKKAEREAKKAERDAARGLSQDLTDTTKIQDISLAQIQAKLDAATNSTNTNIAKIDSTIGQITDKDRGGLRGLYSDAEVRMLEDKKRVFETQKISEELQARKESQPLYEQLLVLAEQEKIKVLASAQSYTDKKKAIDNYNEAAKVQIENANKIAELENEELARSGELVVAKQSISTQIATNIDKYIEQMRIQEDLGLNIDKNLNDTFDNARSSFNTFIKDFVKGNQTAGDSFRAFASSVIEKMLDMATSSVTNQLFSGILGFAKNAVLGSPIGPTQTANADGFFGMNSGGYVRAAAGTAVNTRDSKKILARPGEYLLRNSAVDMIGKGNLDAINAMGNRKISDSASGITPMAAAPQPAPVNVYVVSPDAKPTLTKTDVLVTIQEDIARGGNTSKLIKQIGR